MGFVVLLLPASLADCQEDERREQKQRNFVREENSTSAINPVSLQAPKRPNESMSVLRRPQCCLAAGLIIYTHITHPFLHSCFFLSPNFFYSPSNQLNTLITILPSCQTDLWNSFICKLVLQPKLLMHNVQACQRKLEHPPGKYQQTERLFFKPRKFSWDKYSLCILFSLWSRGGITSKLYQVISLVLYE